MMSMSQKHVWRPSSNGGAGARGLRVERLVLRCSGRAGGVIATANFSDMLPNVSVAERGA